MKLQLMIVESPAQRRTIVVGRKEFNPEDPATQKELNEVIIAERALEVLFGWRFHVEVTE